MVKITYEGDIPKYEDQLLTIYGQFHKRCIIDNEDIIFLNNEGWTLIVIHIKPDGTRDENIFSIHENILYRIKAVYQGGAIELRAVCLCVELGSEQFWAQSACHTIYLWCVGLVQSQEIKKGSVGSMRHKNLMFRLMGGGYLS